MGVVCRVPGCRRLLKKALGVQRHDSAMLSGSDAAPLPPCISIICIESGDEVEESGKPVPVFGASGGVSGGCVGVVVALHS